MKKTATRGTNAKKKVIVREPQPNGRNSSSRATLAPTQGTLFQTLGIILVGVCTSIAIIATLFIIESRSLLYQALIESEATVASTTELFPLGVFPSRKEIVELPDVDSFFANHIETRPLARARQKTWFGQTFSKLASFGWYQNLASPRGRVLVVQAGQRAEEVAQHAASVLGWSFEDRKRFLALVAGSSPEMQDGKFVPGTYAVDQGVPPEALAPMVISRFETEVRSRYGTSTEAVIPLEHALTVASLLEREAYDFTDMREISGIIWNRIFVGMNLQIDATLQYAKANLTTERKWWPRVLPSDKFIASVYNTYENPGLPPAPIANPSLEAVLAALNPRKTECMFYFHDTKGKFFCTKTYEEHVAMLKKVYGRGR